MSADGTYTAVVDRFEGGLAVLLLEADGETVGENVLDADRLPDAGRHVDAVLEVEIADDSVVDVTYAPAETEARADRAQSRFDALAERPPSSDDDSAPDSETDGDPELESDSESESNSKSEPDSESADDPDST